MLKPEAEELKTTIRFGLAKECEKYIKRDRQSGIASGKP